MLYFRSDIKSLRIYFSTYSVVKNFVFLFLGWVASQSPVVGKHGQNCHFLNESLMCWTIIYLVLIHDFRCFELAYLVNYIEGMKTLLGLEPDYLLHYSLSIYSLFLCDYI